jgi:hypothetical protein
MIPANGAPHDLEARDVHRSLSFAQRRARDNGTDQLQYRAIEGWQTPPGSLQSSVVVDFASGVGQSSGRTLACIRQVEVSLNIRVRYNYTEIR